MGKCLSIALSFLLLCFVTPALPYEPEDLQQQIDNAITEEQLTGIVWSLVSEESVETGSTGFASKSQDVKMLPDHKVHVGSVTKPVLAMGVLRLATEGLLTLNANVEALLPELTFFNPWQETNPITVEHLLNHTAGLDNIRMWQFFSDLPTPDTDLREAFPTGFRNPLKVRSKPGEQYSYSNMGYALLAMVIEKVTGARYEQYLDKNLLQPLGMTNSTFEFVSQTGDYGDELLAMGHFENDVEQTALPMYLRPAGQFTTTAMDMAKFIKFIFDDGVTNGRQLIQSQLMKHLALAEKTNATNAGLQVGHGLVFALRDRHNVLGMCHPGTTLGFRAYLCLFPDEKKAFFYAINTDNETADYERFNAIFIENLSLQQAPVAGGNVLKQDFSRLEGYYLPSPNNMAQFELVDILFNYVKVENKNDHLLLTLGLGKETALSPLGSTLFRSSGRTLASHVFMTDTNGDLFVSNGLSTFKKTLGFALFCYWISLLLGLIGLAYITLVGGFRLFKKNVGHRNNLSWPFMNVIGLGIPVILFFNQSLIEFGDLTLASISLAIISGLLPISLFKSLIVMSREGVYKCWQKLDMVANLMALQFCLLLVYWELLPVVFWR